MSTHLMTFIIAACVCSVCALPAHADPKKKSAAKKSVDLTLFTEMRSPAQQLTPSNAASQQGYALKDSNDWDSAASEMKRLQAEWKTVGPVKKSRSEALWQRFRGAADHFFARYSQRHDIALGERVAAREAVCQELEALAAPMDAEPPADLMANDWWYFWWD